MGNGTHRMGVPTLRPVIAAIWARICAFREWVVFFSATGGGVLLALGLCSPSRDTVTAIAGVSVYFAATVIDPLKGLILWLITQPLLERNLNISLGAGIPDLSLTRLCIALITVLLLARTATRQYRLRPLGRFDVLALLFTVGMMQCAPRGINGVSTIQSVFDLYWVPILTYFTVKNLVTSLGSVHVVLSAVLCVALYTAVYALYETMTGDVLFASREYSFYFYSDSGLRLLRGIWGGNMDFGRTLVMGIPIGFYFYLRTPSLARKAVCAVCLGLIFVGLYFTYKRAAWVAMVVVMFVMQSFYPQFRRLFIILLIGVVIATALNWDDISTSTVYTDRVNSQNSTAEGRTKGWEHALEFWAHSPLVGHGFNQYRNLARAAGYRDTAVESEYLNILVSSGLVGFLPFVGLLGMMAYDSLRYYRGEVADGLADRDLIAVFWGILAGYAITISTAIVTDIAIPSMFFAVAGAILYSRRPGSGSSASDAVEVGGRQMPYLPHGSTG